MKARETMNGEYRIKNQAGQYWDAGVFVDDIEKATIFEGSERATVKLYKGESWEKVQ